MESEERVDALSTRLVVASEFIPRQFSVQASHSKSSRLGKTKASHTQLPHIRLRYITSNDNGTAALP